MTESHWYADKEVIEIQERKLAGLLVRTSYQNEINPQLSKISQTVMRYWTEGVFNKFPDKINSQNTYAVYSNYSSDEYGEYDYFFGNEVSSFDNIPNGLATMILPASKIIKFTTKAGPMPKVLSEAWQKIWKMSDIELGGERIYLADFEIYDQRVMNPMSVIIDIYIGIK